MIFFNFISENVNTNIKVSNRSLEGLGNCSAEQFCKIVQIVLPVLCVGNCETLVMLNLLVPTQKCTLRTM